VSRKKIIAIISYFCDGGERNAATGYPKSMEPMGIVSRIGRGGTVE
jgi:hypothetical protein